MTTKKATERAQKIVEDFRKNVEISSLQAGALVRDIANAIDGVSNMRLEHQRNVMAATAAGSFLRDAGPGQRQVYGRDEAAE